MNIRYIPEFLLRARPLVEQRSRVRQRAGATAGREEGEEGSWGEGAEWSCRLWDVSYAQINMKAHRRPCIEDSCLYTGPVFQWEITNTRTHFWATS